MYNCCDIIQTVRSLISKSHRHIILQIGVSTTRLELVRKLSDLGALPSSPQ